MRANDCQWSLHDAARNIWRGQCSLRTQFFLIGGPTANGWETCPFCGGYLVEVKLGA